MADRPFKTPNKEGTIESSVKKRSDTNENKSRSPIITRSRSRNRDDILRIDLKGAIAQPTRSSKRLKSNSESDNNNSIENKKLKACKTELKQERSKSKRINQTKQELEKGKTNLHLSSSSSIPSSSGTKCKNFKLKKSLSTGNNKTIETKISKNNKSRCLSTNRTVMDQNGPNFPNNLSTSSSNNNTSNNNDQIFPGTSTILSTFAQDEPPTESDMNRLQSLLESRNLHQHFIGLPRMPGIFYRSFSNTPTNTKATQLINGLNSASNDSEKLHYVLEMCQILLMGNEDTLVGFPIKNVVPTLINLLSMEHNFEIMHHACRALTYMMEALPRSSVVVLDAIPVFLEKLQVIQYMDVAEQSLSALEMLSRRHNKAILHARGVSACLTYLDFFSIGAQRSALTITANCFQNLAPDDFQYVQDSLPILSSHLTIDDKKCVESICLAFYRLIDCYQNDCEIISEVASNDLLGNIQNVLMASPQILSPGSFVNVIRMLSIMCLTCSQIAVELLKLNICETLKCLLLCNDNVKDKCDAMNLISRSPQEICELTSFIAELMPSLPLNGIFSIDLLFSKTNVVSSDMPVWQWKDERGLWQPFNVIDNKKIESAHQNGEDELEVESLNRNYLVDFNSMLKICEDTGNSYAIQRKTSNFINSELLSRSNIQSIDPRSEFIYKENQLTSNFIQFVFKVLNEVYNNSAGYFVRYKCLNAILRIIYYAPKELLESILENQSISSSIAAMLAQHDFRIVVCAVQMCNILMEKMPEIFSIYFQREGVVHQIRRLYSEENKKSTEKCRDVFINKFSNNLTCQSFLENAQMFTIVHSNDSVDSMGTPTSFSSINQSLSYSPVKQFTTEQNNSGRTEEILKRKRTRKNIPNTNSRNSINFESSIENAVNENDVNICSSLSTTYLNNLPLIVTESINNANNIISNNHKNSNRLGSSKDFLQRLNPSRWARWTQNSVNPQSNIIPTTSNSSKLSSITNTTAIASTTSTSTTTASAVTANSIHNSNNNREKILTWIKEQGKLFDEKYFMQSDANNKQWLISSNILCNLNDAINLLKQDANKGLLAIKNILLDSDLSSFELHHSGLVKNLFSFLIANDDIDKRELNIRNFLEVFIGVPKNELPDNIEDLAFDAKPFSILINKLNACLSQLEQFPLRTHEYTRNLLKYMTTNFLKICLNRHPSCTNLRKYKGPLIKLEPTTTVQSIERFLLSKGYGKIKANDDDQSDDELSDDESLDLNINSSSSQDRQSKHRLELLIGEHVLPYNISLCQAIKQFMSNDAENESEDAHMANSKFWLATFYIYYRPCNDVNNVSSSTATSAVSSANNNRSSRRCKNKNSSGNNKKKDELWLEGKVPISVSPMECYLKNNDLINVNINDKSADVISLLRVLYGINRYWGHFYSLGYIYKPAIPLKQFINNKLTIKANRHLQDPMVIITGSLPSWLSDLAYVCPFMFPFEIRYLLFYVVCFDRERALQRLFETLPDLSSADYRERFLVPRLEKKKKIISRNEIFRSAETLFNDTSNSKAILEVQYENEVGTGLGPTLEFYALLSKEFQRAELEMWRGQILINNVKNEKADNYIYSNYGLFPMPIGRNMKLSNFTKIKHRFKLLGKFMAKALMDSRMIDINLNVLFYKWLLNKESTLCLSDLFHLDHTFFSSISQMHKIAERKSKLTSSNSNSELFKLHGSSIEDLNLDFIMPGFPNIELRKGGKEMAVTLNNLGNYIDLVSYWSLVEGVTKQMEAFKDGFNSVFDLSHLKLFYPEELEQLFCGSNYKNWDIKMLIESCKTDHGFTHESRAIKFLFEILSSYNIEEQRNFLQFLTGSPRLPIGGFKSLNPPFTIVKKSLTESDNPNCLPSVMTCVNYLKLPDYPTIDIMREKLKMAINEGQFSFHLS